MRKVLGGGLRNGARATTDGVLVTATASRARTLTLLFSIFAALVAAFAFSGPALAAEDEGAQPPSISSDKIDYAPGELVTLRGSNWLPGETVNIDVNDNEGQSWRRNVDVTADADGKIVDSFNLPNWFVATYAVIASGENSGTAATSFTDSNPQAIEVAAPTSVTVAQSTTATYGTLTLEAGGNSNPCNTTFSVVPGGGTGLPAGATPVWGTNPITTTGDDVTTSFSVQTAGSTPTGTYTFRIAGTNSAPSGGQCQGGGPSNSALLTLVVTQVNVAPVAADDSSSVNEDLTLNVAAPGVLGNDTDADANSLTAVLVTGPGNGTLTLNANGSFTYTPNANFFGSDSFTYRANDGSADSSTASVSLTVTAVNDAPSFTKGADQTVDEDAAAQSVSGWATAISAGAANESGQALTFSASNDNNGLFLAQPAVSANGTLTFTPAANAHGSATVTVSLSDDGGTANGGVDTSAAQTFTITVTSVNDAPTCSSGSATTPEDTPKAIDLTCADLDGDPLTYAIVSGPSNGTLTGTGASRTYTPNEDYNGPDSFTFEANDGAVDSVVATFSLTVTPVNDDPVARDDEATVAEDSGANAIDVLANDDDGPDSGESLTVTAATQGANGSVTFTATGVSYTPDANFFGSDSFTYTISDGNGGTATAGVDVTVTNVNDAPLVAADEPTLTVDEGQTAANTGTWSDIDVGDTVTLNASAGAVVKNADGTWSWSFSTSDGPENGQTITITAEDSAGADATATFELTVDNVAPSVSLSGANEVDEGDTETYSYTVTDPGDDTWTANLGYPTCGLNGMLVAGSHEQTAGGGTFECHFPDGDESTNVAVKVTDSDGASDTASEQVIIVEIANVAPVVTAAGAQSSDEGESKSFSLGTFTDPGSDSPWSVEVNWGDGSPSTSFNEAAAGAIVEQSHTYADNGSYTVSVKVTDKDGASDTDTFQVTAANVAPTATLEGAPSTSDEGAAISLTGSFTDPGADTHTQSWSVTKDGSAYGSGGTGASFSFTPDDDGSYAVSYTVTDDDGGTDTDTKTITVSNVAPTLTLSGADAASEGATVSYSYSWTDPGSADTFPAADNSVSCGLNGTASNLVFTPAAKTGSFDCTWSDDSGAGTAAVSATVGDDDSGSDTETIQVSIANVAPTATFGNDGPVDEGSSFTLSLTDPADPSLVDDAAGFEYAFDCGDGLGYGAYLATSTRSCPTTDNGTRAVKGQIRDKDGGVTEYTAQVTVNNVAPEVTVNTPNENSAPMAVGASVVVNASFTDAGSADTHTCLITWGDGTTTPGMVDQSADTCTASRAYTGAGVYTITVNVTDDDGGEGSAQAMQVVYDPNGGFVTGGGWILSPAGAYVADPTAWGKANFGFVSKYQKGAKVPTGETEFQFKAGNLDFHSAKYEWLVVSGARAQYKGTGTINGGGEYGFLLTATDGQRSGGGGVDKFRIKIWEVASGATVYDNKIGASDDLNADNTQALGGGSIVIHEAGKK